MEWYYAEGDRQCGPISEQELQGLANSGKLQRESLVWREGMANWEPFSSVQLSPAPMALSLAPPVITANGTTCSQCGRNYSPTELVTIQNSQVCASCKPIFLQKLREQTVCSICGRPFALNDMVRIQNSWACAACKPTLLQRLQEGAAPVAFGSLWRSDKLLVATTTGAVFPDRCLKCNASTNGKLMKRTLYWYPPWVIIILIASWLIGLIVAMIVRKTAKVEIGLCDAHRSKRIRNITIGTILAIAGFILLIVSAVNESGIGAIFCGVAVIAGIVFMIMARIVSVKKMDNTHAWIKGVCPQFLEGLPEWRGF